MRRQAGLLKRDCYRDSVFLMRVSRRLREIPGVVQAEVLVATQANLDVLRNAGLLPTEIEQARPKANDLVVVVEGDTSILDRAVSEAEALIDGRSSALGTSLQADSMRSEVLMARSVPEALTLIPDANLAVISITGLYVRREAFHALRRGLNLMIFSSNVP